MDNMALNTTLGHYLDSSWVPNNNRHVDGAGDGGALIYFTRLYTALMVISIFCAPFALNYIATWFFFHLSHMTSKTAIKVPPTVPYMVPVVGSIFNLAFNGLDFVHKATWQSGKQSPFRVAAFRTNIYFAHGAENIISLFKNSSSATGIPVQLFCLKHLFGMPPKALDIYASDNSGINAQSLPGSMVAPHNRVDHLTHASLVKFTSGNGLSGFYSRWITAFKRNLDSLEIGNDWLEMPDLLDFFRDQFGAAATEAICGNILMKRVNPNFMRDLDEYDRSMPSLSKGFPSWMIPKAYAIRNKLLANIKEWHSIAREEFRESSVHSDGDFDPYWGSEFIRSRQKLFESIDDFEYDAYAASDLGFIWATNTNTFPSSFWATMETFRDPSLLHRVRSELKSTFDAAAISRVEFDVDKLLKAPLLQSIYSETLRLRIQMYIMRYTDRNDLRLHQWIFPKNSIVLVSTTTAQTDKEFWNTGKENNHPVDKFWADRFLVYPNDSYSGPCSRKAAAAQNSTDNGKQWKSSSHLASAATESEAVGDTAPAIDNHPRFSLSGTNGHFIPYGGGPRICPGRHFAKRGIISACAIMATMFDVEILLPLDDVDDKALRMDPSFHGLGGRPPAGKVPFRIRKRQCDF